MKIIAVGSNYANSSMSAEEKTRRQTEPIVFLKPDSALLKDGRPFFVPDFSADVRYEAELVVRISRLGKCVDKQFAHRYYDAVTVGIDFTADDLQKQYISKGLPWELSKGFDDSAAIGTFIPLAQVEHCIQNIDFSLDVDGAKTQVGCTADMLCTVDSILAYVSRFMTLKIGDLLFTGAPVGSAPVKVGQHLDGYIGDTKVLDFNIR